MKSGVSGMITATAPSSASATARPATCVAGFNQCTANGCETSGSKRAIFNQAKRRGPIGNVPVFLNISDFAALQSQSDQALGLNSQGHQLTATERNLLQNFSVLNGIVGESRLIKLTGYLARGLDPHPNTGESVNCRFTEPENNDFHVSLSGSPTISTFQGIVVEMIPQNRSAKWTISKLLKIKQRNLRVMAIGGLFYDNDHVVNANENDPIPRQPARFSLWEVHPIRQFFVCPRPDGNCRVNTLTDWVALDDF